MWILTRRHHSFKRIFALFLMIAPLTAGLGCAGGGSGPAFTELVPKPGTGIIYIYREGKFVGGNNVHYLRANGDLITRVGNGGYFPYVAPPGNVTFSTRLRPSAAQLGSALITAALGFEDVITIPVEAGEIYYVRFNYYGYAELVSEAVGEKEIRELKQFDPATE